MSEAYQEGKTVVFWDIGSCNVPDGVDVSSIIPNIRWALSKLNYIGPISFFAFGDTPCMKEETVEAISRTAFILHQVEGEGDKFHAFGAIAVAMFSWAKQNRGPANYVIISGNKDFSHALKKLKDMGYNLLLGHPTRQVPEVLANYATHVWYWEDFLAGGSPLPFLPEWVNSRGTRLFIRQFYDDLASTSSSSPTGSVMEDKTGSNP